MILLVSCIGAVIAFDPHWEFNQQVATKQELLQKTAFVFFLFFSLALSVFAVEICPVCCGLAHVFPGKYVCPGQHSKCIAKCRFPDSQQVANTNSHER